MRVFGFVSNISIKIIPLQIIGLCLDILAAEDTGEERGLPAPAGPQQREDGAAPHLMTVMIMMIIMMILTLNISHAIPK